MKKLIIVLALLFNYSPTYAVVNTGADLIEKCDSYISYMGNKDIPDSNFAYAMGICMGFVDGVVYTHSVARTGSPIWCLPNNVNSDAIIRVLVNHIRDNPDAMQKNLGPVVLVAMVNAFPCDE
jgi:hypothetical protein